MKASPVYPPTFNTGLHPHSHSFGTSNSYHQDSTYGTGSYKRQLASTNDSFPSYITGTSNDQTKLTDFSDLLYGDLNLPVGPTDTQPLTEAPDKSPNPMPTPLQRNGFDSMEHGPKKRAISFGSENGDRPLMKYSKKSPSNLIGATTEQQARLEHQLREWETRSHLPTEKEVRAIATLAGLSFLKVAMWYGDKLRLDPQDSPNREGSSTDPSAVQDVTKYIKDAKTKTCRSTHSGKAQGGKYICTRQCGYSTNQRDAWIRHEEKRQPQKFWHCK